MQNERVEAGKEALQLDITAKKQPKLQSRIMAIEYTQRDNFLVISLFV